VRIEPSRETGESMRWHAARYAAVQQMRRGLGIGLVGALVTGATYAFASSQGGGIYLVTWGAVAFGLLTAIAGLIRFLFLAARRPRQSAVPPEDTKTCSRCGALAPYWAEECPNCHAFPFPSSQSASAVQLAPVRMPIAGPTEPESTKRCLGCNRRVPGMALTCPYCRYSFSPRSIQIAKLRAISASPHEEQSPQDQPQRARAEQNAPVTHRTTTAIPEQIRMLGVLRDEGLLTEDEFQEKKQELLKRI
jgi:RNA polymerase subunit RPABC4/transcription elongation factor Spt4